MVTCLSIGRKLIEDAMGSKDLRLRHAIHRLLHQQTQEHRMAGAVAFNSPDSTTNTTVADAAAATVPSSLPEDVVSTAAENATVAVEIDMMRPYYIIGVSILILFCFVTFIFNVVILASAFWIRRPMSPTLSLSVSLAGADAYSSLFLGTGLFVNSLLPYAFGISVENTALGTCVMLAFEALRVGGVLVSVAHLLALAINHYLGILRPLHYAATLTPRITSMLIVALWVLPIAFFFVYFSSVEGQGFRSATCEYMFILQFGFRAVFSLLFFLPLALMAVIYLHIYCIVRRTQCSRQRSRLGRLCEEGGRGLVRATSGENAVDGGGRGTTRSRQLARNWKAVITTMLILGTYVVGWIPAVLLYLLVCKNCAIHFENTDRRTMFVVYSFVNLLIILKSLSDPIIYAARMQEIKAALGRMKEAIFGLPVQQGAASGVDSSHGYARPRGSIRSDGCCNCCRVSYPADHGVYGSDISRNRMSTYASTASGGNATALSNNVVLFRIKSLHNSSANGGATASKRLMDPKESSMGQLHRSSTRSQQRRRDDVRNKITGI